MAADTAKGVIENIERFSLLRIEQFTRAGATLGYDQRYEALENLGRIY